jgi:hypothetical protein
VYFRLPGCIQHFPHPRGQHHRKPRETLGTRARRARRAAMAKNRNKKNRAKSGGLAAMDTSEGGPATSTAADVPQRTFPLPISFISYGCFLCSPPFGLYDGSVHDFLFFVWQQWTRPRESSHRRPQRRSVRSTSKLNKLQHNNYFYLYNCTCVHRGSFCQL